MTTIGELFIKLKANTSDFDKGMDNASNKANTLGGVISTVSKNIASFMIYDVGKKLVSGFVDATKAGIGYNAMLETSSIAWKQLLNGSASEAKKTIKMLENLAAVTPFDYEGVDQFAKKLEIAGLGGKDLEKNILAVGDAVAGVGGNTETLNGVATALSQMAMKGKISAEEMQQLAERGIPSYKLLSEAMGVTEAELMKLMQSGKVMSKDALPLLIGQMEKAFGGSMANNVGTFNGDVSTLKDTFRETAGVLTKPLFEKLKEGISTSIPLLNNIKDSLNENGLMGTIQKFAPGAMPFIQAIIGIFNTLKDSMKVIIDAIMGFWEEHKSWLLPLIQFVWNFIATFISQTINAIGKVVQSGLAIIDGIINLFQNLFKGNFQGAWESIKQIFSNAITFVWNLMQVMFAFNLPGMIKNFGASAGKLFSNMWTSIKGFFSGGITGCLNFVKNLLSGATTNFNTLRTFGANAFNALWQVAKNAMSKLLSSVITYIRQVPTNVRSFMTQAVNVIRNINLFTIGKNLIQGLINGIKNMAGNVIGAIGGVVTGAVDAAKRKLGINSPSRVFKEFGMYTGMGLVEGIEGQNKSVLKASQNLSSSVMTGYSANISSSIKTGLKGNSNESSSSGLFNLHIENFNNNTDKDIEYLANELAFYLKRKNIALGGV